MAPGSDDTLEQALDHARRHSLLTLLLVIALVLLGWAAFAPIGGAERKVLLDITSGTSARKQAGDITGALPRTMRLTLGVRDVLHIKNNDTVLHYLGAIALKPGKQMQLPFEHAGASEFTSSAHFGGTLTIVVEPMPDPGTARVRWRTLESIRAIRHY